MRFLFFLMLVSYFHRSNAQHIVVGAEQMDSYIGQLRDRRVGVVCNQTSEVSHTHIVDTLLSQGINIEVIFAPEHGYRGQADAGSKVKNTMDKSSGIFIESLYGRNLKPSTTSLSKIDVMVFDIQDVGARFYTYISTLQYVMEACADRGIPLIILDRPNPNGHYVDGPVLESKLKSFVGMQPIPVVYGMTMGEYAKMLVGERWIHTSNDLNLSVIKCANYTHKSSYKLPIAPSPNLKSSQAINLYPSLCLFEGTNVSVGRGTDFPFELYGSPYLDSKKMKYTFTPQSKLGAKTPPFLNKKCYGESLSTEKSLNQFSLKYLLKAYQNWTLGKDSFFLKNKFFDNLAGSDLLRKQILQGMDESQIRKSWQVDIQKFKTIRKKYLLYEDFE